MSKSALLYRGRRDAIETTHAVDILENFRSRTIFLTKFAKISAKLPILKIFQPFNTEFM